MNKRSLSLIVSACLFISFGAQANKLNGLDNYVKELMAISRVPGVAVSVVKGDEVVLAQGYGVRELGKRDLVDKDTLFAIGSNTKYFTATALGLLVEESKVSWDEPLSHYIPGLRFSDPYLTAHINLRDALSHRTGLQRSDYAWYVTPGASRAEMLAVIEKIPAQQSFRSGFLYNNFMFLAAGEVIPSVTGETWDAFLKQRLFVPLGMKRTNTSVAELKTMRNVATPHFLVGDKVVPTRYFDISHLAVEYRSKQQWYPRNCSVGVSLGTRIHGSI